jgi:hypothetical protein
MSEDDLALTTPRPTEPVEPVREDNEADAAFETRKRSHADQVAKYQLEKKM